jgi:hypothetical protein
MGRMLMRVRQEGVAEGGSLVGGKEKRGLKGAILRDGGLRIKSAEG